MTGFEELELMEEKNIAPWNVDLMIQLKENDFRKLLSRFELYDYPYLNNGIIYAYKDQPFSRILSCYS